MHQEQIARRMQCREDQRQMQEEHAHTREARVRGMRTCNVSEQPDSVAKRSEQPGAPLWLWVPHHASSTIVLRPHALVEPLEPPSVHTYP
jgi:hypothetical protein